MPTSSGATTRRHGEYNYSGSKYASRFATTRRNSPSIAPVHSGPSYSTTNNTRVDSGTRLTARERYRDNKIHLTSDLNKLDLKDNRTPDYYTTKTSSSEIGSHAYTSKPLTKPYLQTTSRTPERISVHGGPSISSTSKLRHENSSGSLISDGQISPTSRYYLSTSDVSLSSRKHSNRNDSCGSHNSADDLRGVAERSGNVGLSNLGNTCFMNSVLQCLLNTRPLIEYIRESFREEDINRTTSSMKGVLFKAFASLVEQVWGHNPPNSLAPSALKNAVQKYAPRFSGYNQQDSQEFLRYLLEGLHGDINRVRTKPKYIEPDDEAEKKMNAKQKAEEYWKRYLNFDDSYIVDVFVGQLRSTLKCDGCHYESVTFDPFWDLSLPIPKRSHRVSIHDCMELFMKEEQLDGNERPKCSNCKERQRCTKRFRIEKFPKILVLHLKRFSGERYRSKLTTTVDFDVRGLNLSNFAADTGGKSRSTYDLYGISNHVGSVYSGHYTAQCKHPYQNKWYQFNDSSVSKCHPETLKSDEAYVLFYELAQ